MPRSMSSIVLTQEGAVEEKKLGEAESALHQYARANNQVSFEESENIVLQSLKQFQAECRQGPGRFGRGTAGCRGRRASPER